MKNILITGASGYLGNLLVAELSQRKEELGIENLVATDVRKLPKDLPGVIFEILDVRDPVCAEIFNKHKIDCVIHLASIVTPGKKSSREFEYSVDVQGTSTILKACVKSKVKRIIVSSSGAAYGYTEQNNQILTEESKLCGNYEFAYSYHKRLVEEELKVYRELHPELEQVIFRISTILGENVNNQITDLFKKKVQIGLWGTDIRFSIIWDMDAVGALVHSISNSPAGIYNLAGDGFVTISERAEIMEKSIISLPPGLIKFGLGILKFLGLSQYGPEQTRFLQYRPVLDNSKLKNKFGYMPQKTSRENFLDFAKRL